MNSTAKNSAVFSHWIFLFRVNRQQTQIFLFKKKNLTCGAAWTTLTICWTGSGAGAEKNAGAGAGAMKAGAGGGGK